MLASENKSLNVNFPGVKLFSGIKCYGYGMLRPETRLRFPVSVTVMVAGSLLGAVLNLLWFKANDLINWIIAQEHIC